MSRHRQLLKEYHSLVESTELTQQGIIVQASDDLLLWDVVMRDFDPESLLGQDLHRLGPLDEEVRLQMKFKPTYPLEPPFIRVVSPRFTFHTGHVTVGGSICMELLVNTGTPSGWQPEISLGSVLIMIRQAFIDGGARVDTSGKQYAESEAQSAFSRVASQHGWVEKRPAKPIAQRQYSSSNKEGNGFVWESHDPRTGVWTPYDPITAQTLENLFQNGKPTCSINIGGKSFQVRFNEWRQYNESGNYRECRRRQ